MFISLLELRVAESLIDRMVADFDGKGPAGPAGKNGAEEEEAPGKRKERRPA